MGSQIAFEQCLKKNGLRIAADAKRLVAKEITAAENDLK